MVCVYRQHTKYSMTGKKSKPGAAAFVASVFSALLCAMVLPGCAGTVRAQQTGDESMLLGWVDRAALVGSGFPLGGDSTHVQPELLELLRQLRDAADWLVFFGSWCGDTKSEVPKFLSVADQAGIRGERIRLYGLDRSKRSPDGLAGEYQIERVPTFVALKDGQEIGRITETPRVSMEADMLVILAGGR